MQEENLQEYEKNSFEMTPEIQEHYDKVREIISQEEFFERMEKFRQQESANPFLNDSGLAEMVVGELIDEEVEVISEKPEFAVDTIDKLEKPIPTEKIENNAVTIEGVLNKVLSKILNEEIIDLGALPMCLYGTFCTDNTDYRPPWIPCYKELGA